jgi:predicted dehydrogenase
MRNTERIRLGIIGLGEIGQVVHLPNIDTMPDRFTLTAFCDVSPGLLEYMGKKHGVSSLYEDYRELVANAEVDAVMVLNSVEYHADCAVAALEAGKHVFIEKPMCLTRREAEGIVDAQERSGKLAMVGYMRRYAAAFLRAKEEVAELDQINYARIRDIIGLNQFYTEDTSLTVRFDDIPERAVEERNEKRRALLGEAVGDMTEELARFYQFCGGLASHDFSAMRELIGMPKRVIGAYKKAGSNFAQVLFDFAEFAGVYEVGVDKNRRFDAHIAVYGPQRTVTVQYDTPYIRHLPTTLRVQATEGKAYSDVCERPTYQDPFTAELIHFHECISSNTPPKTSPADAIQDLELSRMVVDAIAGGREA